MDRLGMWLAAVNKVVSKLAFKSKMDTRAHVDPVAASLSAVQ